MNEIYICDACHYLFELDNSTDRCPDCGKNNNIRPADGEEQEEYRKLRMEF